mgnify:CR=1 FL=1
MLWTRATFFEYNKRIIDDVDDDDDEDNQHGCGKQNKKKVKEKKIR